MLLLVGGISLFALFSFSSLKKSPKEKLESAISLPIVSFDDPACNWVNNDEFDSGTANWNHYDNGASYSSTFTINSGSQLSGTNSAFINISSVGGSDWGIEFRSEPHAIANETQYAFRFDARATSNRNITVVLQERQSPWTVYHTITIPITTTATEYGPYYWTSNVSQSNTGLVFRLGESAADVYLDDVIFGEADCLLGTTTISSRINNNDDDAEEQGTGGGTPGSMYFSSSDLEFVNDTEDGRGNQKVGLRFNNLDIPQGAIIRNAYIRFNAVSADSPNLNSGTASLTIRAEDSDNAPAMGSANYYLSNRTMTSNLVNWNPSAWSSGINYYTPSITSIVQELVDRTGWDESSSSMLFIISGTGSRSANAHNNSSSNAPILFILYSTNNITGKVYEDFNGNATFDGSDAGESGVTVRLYEDNDQDGTVSAGDVEIDNTTTDANGDYSFYLSKTFNTTGTYNDQVSQNSDDATDGDIADSKIELGLDKWGGVRFQNISIPAGATISSAYIEFRAESGNSSGSPQVNIYAHDISNPSAFSSSGSNVSSRTRTTQSQSWALGGWSDGNYYQSPDISNVVQEIVNSYGAYSGGEMAFLFQPVGNEVRNARTRDYGSSSAPRLVINYLLSAGPFHYVAETDVSTLPTNYMFTTDNLETAVFSAAGNDTGNDFGFLTFNVSAGTDTDICIGENATLTATHVGGTGAVTYSWSNGLGAGATKTVNPLVTTTYTVTATDGASSTSVDQVTITVNQLPTANAGTPSTICLGESASFTATATGGSGSGYTYVWDNSLGTDANQTVTPSSSTIYTVTVTDGNGCTDTDQVTITVRPELFANAGANVNLCTGYSTILNATATGGTGTYTSYVWNNGLGAGASQTVSPVVTTTYTVTITDSNGCTDIDQTTITLVGNPPTVTASSDVEICNGENTLLTATPSGGTGTYTYSWDNGLGSSSSHLVSPSTTTTYNVTISDGNGCTDTDQVIITVNDLPTPNAGADVGICPGGNTTLTASASGGSGGYTYTWNNGLGVGASKIVSPATNTTYIVTVSDSKGCTSIDAVLVTINSTPTANAGSDATICNGENTTLSASGTGGSGSYTFTWDNGLGAGAAKVVSPSSTTIYTVTISDGNGCTNTDQVTINVNPLPTANAGSNVEICNGQSNTLTATASGGSGAGYTYVWDNGLGAGASKSATPSATTFYNVTVTDGNGCTNTDQVLVTVNPLPIADAGVNQGYCPGGNATITATVTGGDGSFTFAWDNSLGAGASHVVTPSGTVTYTVTVTDGNGCTDIDAITLTPIIVGVNASADVSICPGDTTTLTAAGSGGDGNYTYAWSGGLGAGASVDAFPSVNTTYMVTVTDGSGCTATDDIAVSIYNNTPTITPSADVTICEGENTIISASATGGVGTLTYTWSEGLGTGTSKVVSPTSTNTYSVTVSDGNGCEDVEQIEVTVNPTPVINMNVVSSFNGEDVSCVSANDGSAQASPVGTAPFSYNWTSGDNTSIATGLTAGTYTVTVTDGNLCTASATITLNNPPALSGSAAVTSDYNTAEISCNGGDDGEVTVTSSGGVSPHTYIWNDPLNQTSASASSLSAGTYTVTITDANGCTSTTDVSIAEPIAITISISKNDAGCPGETNGDATASSSGGTSGFTYAWSSGGSAALENNLGAGTYTVTATDANGCTSTGETTIIESSGLTATTSVVDASCSSNNDGSATVTPSGGLTPYLYSWSSGGSTATESGLSAGTYTVTVTDNALCTWIVSVNVSSASNFGATISGTDISCFGDADGTITVTPVGGTPTFTYEWSDVSLPEARWTFENTLNDISGNAHDAQSVDGGTEGYNVDAQEGSNSLDLAGNTRIQYSVNSGFMTGALTQQTVMMWVKPDALSGEQVLFEQGGTDEGFAIRLNGNQLEAGVAKGFVQQSVSAIFPNTNWHLVAAVYDNGELSLFLDGSQVATQSTGFGTITVPATRDGGIGGIYTSDAFGGFPFLGAGYDYYSGLMDDVYFFNESLDSTGMASVLGGTGTSRTGLSAGSYTVTVTDGGGCITIKSITLTEPLILAVTPDSTAVSCNGGNDGEASVAVTGGTFPYVYAWSSGGSSSSETGLIGGTYTVTITDGNDCTLTQSIIVNEPAVLSVPISDTDINCFGANDGTATAAPTGGITPYSYTWSNGSNSPTANNLLPGTFTVTVTDGSGCTASANTTISEPLLLTASASITSSYGAFDISCNGYNDGTATASQSGGTSGYSYEWSNGQTVANLTGATAGTYTVTVTDNNNCTSTASVTFTEPASISLSASITSDFNGMDISCTSAMDGTANAVGSGGAGSVTYSWTNGDNTANASGLGAGTYTVVATDANGCTSSTSVTLQDPALSVSANVTSNYNGVEVSCVGASDGIATANGSNGAGGYLYQWSSGATGTTATNLLAGTYTVTTTDINGCTATASVTVDNPTPLTATPSVTSNHNGAHLSCYGATDGDVAANASGGASPYTYQWSNSGTGSSINNVGVGTYTVTITDANGCTAIGSTDVISPDELTVAATVNSDYNGNDISCAGASDGEVLATPSGGTTGYSYSWTSGDNTNTSSNLNAGTYTVVVTDANGCTASATVFLQDPPGMTVNVSVLSDYNGYDISCPGGSDGSVFASATNGTPIYTYAWSEVSTLSSEAHWTFENSTDDVSGNNHAREDYDGTLSYSPDAVGGSNSFSFDGSTRVEYAVNNNFMNSGFTYCSVAMWIKPTNLNGGEQTLYDEQGDRHGISLRIDDDEIEAAVSEWWLVDNTDPITIPNDGQWHHIAMVYDNGDLTVYLDGVAGTTENTVKGSIPSDNNDGGLGGTFNRDAFGNNNDNFYSGLMDEVMVFNTALNSTQIESLAGGSQMLNNISAGTYTVTVTDGNGCTLTESITISDPPAMSVAFSKTDYNGTEISCPGASDGGLTASITNGYSPYTYSWSSGDNTNNTSGLPAGTYTVTVTDSYGCTVTSSSTLSDPTPVSVTSSITSDYNGFDISCAGGNDGTGLATPTGGTGTYNYLWSDGQTTAILDTASAQTYYVTVTDENGCTGTSSISFSEPTTITASVTSSDLTDCDLTDGAILINASGGIGNYEYRLDAGSWQSTNSYTGLDVGTYNVYIRSSAGSCEQGPYQVTLDFPAAPTINNVTILHPTTSSSNDGSILVDADGNGSLLGLEYRIVGLTGWQTNELFENLDEGTYTIEVGFVSLNCVASTVVTLTAGSGITLTNAQTAYCSDAVTGSSGVETYYIPFPEDQANTVFRTIYDSGCGTLPEDSINTYVSVGVVASNTIIYYDHWEDTFESNINFPIQGSTETWGDGNTLNGFPPGYPSDILNAGDIIVLENVVFAGTTITVTDFDGGDKMVSNGALAVTRLAYPTDPGTLFAGALEVYSIDKWGSSYEIPIGESTDVNNMFEYTGAIVMAKEDNTTISVDWDGNGTIDNTYTINEGKSQLLSNINAGAEITSSADVQVHLITGDECADYETRWFTLSPTSNWSDSYFNPVDSYTSDNDPTYVHLYNPNSSSINVTWATNLGVQGTVNITGGGVANVPVPDNTGSHFYTTNGDVFYAVATIDSESNEETHDWGYALLPEELISSQITMVGFAPGHTPGISSSDNTAPIWVTGDYPTGSTSSGSFDICIDYDGDGGSFVDGNGVSYDAQQTLSPLDLSKIFDPDGDQTGMRVWVCDGSDAIIAGAWGQDPETSQGAGQADELDLGTGLPNGVPYSASICVELLEDQNGNGLFEECDVVEYSILINNTGVLPLSAGSVVISDTISAELTYVDSSTTVVTASGITPVTDDSSPSSAFPLDEGGYSHNTIILPGDSILVKFQASINHLTAPSFVQNTGYISEGLTFLSPNVTFPALIPATPVIPPIPPADTLLSCEQAIPVAPLRDTLGLVFNEVRTDGSCINEYILTRTWTATDYCGNVFVYTQIITVEDNDAPLLSGVPVDVTVDPDNIPAAPTVTGSDNCDATTTVNFNENTSPGSCDYTITRTWDASDVCGNSVSRSQVITVESNMTPSIVIDTDYNSEDVTCEGASDGGFTASVIGGTSPFNYSWSGGIGTGATKTGIPAGTYTVTITDNSLCITTASVTLTEPISINAAASVTSNYNGAQVTCAGASDGIISASGSGGTPGYTYAWSTGDNVQTVIGVNADTYTVTVTDQNGCFDIATVTVVNPTPISASASIASNYNGQNISCLGENDGIGLANATGGSGAYTYAWSNGAATASANNLIVGTYTVTISDANGCSDVASISLSEPIAVAVSTGVTSDFNGEDVSCPSASDGDASASASGGNGGFTYAWSNGQTSAALSNVSAGTYTVTATDNNGCSATNTVTLSEPTAVNVSLAITSNHNGRQISCVGASDGAISSTSIGGTVVGTYSYAWDHGPTTQDISGITGGTYTLVVTDDNGCTASASTTINDPLPLSASLSVTSDYNGADVSCASASDGSVSAAGVGGTPGYTYAWSGGLGTGVSKTGLSAGTYTATITDNNGCTASASTTLGAPSPLSLSTSTTSVYGTENISCVGASDGSASSTASGGTGAYSYSWSNGQSTDDLVNASAGTYTLVITDANGCTASSSVTFSNPTPITISASVTSNFNGQQISCNGASDGTATSSASGGTGSLSYDWTNGQTVANATNLSAGTYTVIATDDNGCTASASVTLIQPLLVNANAGSNQDICNGASASFTATGSGGTAGYTYAWSNGLGSGASKTVSPISTTTYTVTVTDINSCTDTDQIIINVNNPPVANAGSDVTICDGNSTTLIASATGVGGYSYAWSNGLGTGASKSVSPSLSTTYTVTVTDGNGCTDEDQVTVTVNNPTSTITSNSPLCPSVDLNLDVSTATSYSWSGPNGFSSSSKNPTVNSVSATEAGVYYVTITDAIGCTATAISNVVILDCTEDCTNGVDDDGDGDIDCGDSDCIPLANNATLNTCDNSNETGSGTFFLHDANPTVSTQSGIMVSYHPTLLDAQNGTNILISPYTSADATVYARAERVSTGCYNTSVITLDVGAKCAENCNNGIDEDGDGLIDCDDPDCPCCDAYAPTLNGLNKKDP